MDANIASPAEEPGGPWSLARYAQIVAAPRIQGAQSWDQLHRSLAPLGLRYQTVGNTGRLVAIGDDGETTGDWVGGGAAYANAALGKLAGRFKQPYEPAPPDLIVRPLVMPRFNKPDDSATSGSITADQTAKASQAAEAKALEAHLHQTNKQQQEAINKAGLGDRRNAAIKDQAACAKVEQQLAREFSIAIGARRTKDRSGQGKDQARRSTADRSSFKAILWSANTRPPAAAADVKSSWRSRYSVRRTNGCSEYRLAPSRDGDLAFAETANLVLIQRTSRQAQIDALLLAAERNASVRIFGTERAVGDTVLLAAELGIQLENKQQDRAKAHRDEVEAGKRRGLLASRQAWLRMQHELAELRDLVRRDRKRRQRILNQAGSPSRLEYLRSRNRMAVDDAKYRHARNDEPAAARQTIDYLDRNRLLLVASRSQHFLDDDALREAFAKNPQHLLLDDVNQHLTAIQHIQDAERRWIAAALLAGRVSIRDGELDSSRPEDAWASAFWQQQRHDPTRRRGC